VKKNLIIFAIFTLVAAFLASCGGQDSEMGANGTEASGENAGGAPRPGEDTGTGEVMISERDEEILPSSEVINITSFDGYNLQGRITLPGGDRIDTLVIFANATGPQTFDTRRNFERVGGGFANFNDFYATRFQEQGIAFFAYNTRGVDIGGEFPLFRSIDETRFLTNLPANQVRDIYYMINALRTMDERLQNSQVILWGRTEGTIISTMFAELYPHMVDALILISVYVDNMYDILWWHTTGGSEMIWYRYNFEADNYGRISREAFEADPNNIIETALGGAYFELLDANNDGFIDEDDFYILWEMWRNELFRSIENRNNLRLGDLYNPRVTAQWFQEHFLLQSNMERITALDLPIYIFHGTMDMSADVRRVEALRERLAELNRTNVTINILENYDSELDVWRYIIYDEMPDGLQAAFDTVFNFNLLR